MGDHGWWTYFFSCTAKANRPAAGFQVCGRSDNELYISHIMPGEKGTLSVDQCYRVIEEFNREFLVPAAAEIGVKTELIQHRLTMENDLSFDAARLLRDFSSSPNRKSLNQYDRQLWNAFLVQVHRDETLISRASLDEWLQLEGWSEEIRTQLVGEHETARSLLETYDNEFQRRECLPLIPSLLTSSGVRGQYST